MLQLPLPNPIRPDSLIVTVGLVLLVPGPIVAPSLFVFPSPTLQSIVSPFLVLASLCYLFIPSKGLWLAGNVATPCVNVCLYVLRYCLFSGALSALLEVFSPCHLFLRFGPLDAQLPFLFRSFTSFLDIPLFPLSHRSSFHFLLLIFVFYCSFVILSLRTMQD